MIYSNGAAVYDRKNDAHICQQLIPPKAVQRILQTLAPQPLYYNVYWDGGMYLEEARLPYYSSNILPHAVLEQYMAKAHREENLLDKAAKGAESIAVYDLNLEQADWVRSVLEGEGLDPAAAMRDFVGFAFDHLRQNRDFVSLLADENVNRVLYRKNRTFAIGHGCGADWVDGRPECVTSVWI